LINSSSSSYPTQTGTLTAQSEAGRINLVVSVLLELLEEAETKFIYSYSDIAFTAYAELCVLSAITHLTSTTISTQTF